MALFLLVFAALCCSAADLPGAPSYRATRYAEALSALRDAPATSALLLLRGKCHYGLGDFKRAQETFEAAIRADANSSEAWHWLGKAFGKRAESASVFSAPGLARRCRQAFEKAVELDGRNVLAINDLIEYSLEAPGFLGGGDDKAAALAARLAALDPPEHEFARARIAEKKKDWAAAESHYRKASELAPKQAGRAADLAKFLARRGRVAESDAEFARAASIDPASPGVWFARAESLSEGKRNLAEARRLLERYLKAPLTPEDPPRADAEKLLKKAGR